MNEILWQPSEERIAKANLTAFRARVKADWGVDLPDYSALYDWSLEEMEKFWLSIWDFCGVIAETRGEVVIADADKMPGAKFFPDARLNFAENLLRRRGSDDALVFWGEDKIKRRLSWDDLQDRVTRLARALERLGVGPGDRVAGFIPNMPEAVIAMLATAANGAIWSSCSPDFGSQGVLDRFGQIEPKVLVEVDGYHYGGKSFDTRERVAAIAAGLPSLERILVVPYLSDEPDISELERAENWNTALAAESAEPFAFAAMPFNAPLYILYSSGTTGKPKCIVHGAGGTLIQHLKEHQLQCDVRSGDRIFYFSTCGWMMWNWLVTGLASGATLLLFDGNPFYPGPQVLFDFMEAERGTLFGTSAKYIDSLRNAGYDAKANHRLSELRTLTSTGSPLAPEGFDYVYRHIKDDLCLSSIAGGTDIVACFVGGNPTGPVRRGEIQARHLGMAVAVFDDSGEALRGEKGELVCTKPFPSMPVKFWNDPEDERYRAAYFERYPNIWHHGDFIELTENDGIVVYGRSDATLNPGGVRIGTAEIYRQVEVLPEIQEALVIGQDWQNDVRVVLFVRLAEGAALDEELVARIKRRIREGASPRHVPAKVLAVEDIPRTKSGKIVELAVRDIVHGREIKNREALANPEALELFQDIPELRE
jgi:acetoacetyl-CoA synthetase